MKVRETRTITGFGATRHEETRVRSLAADEAAPEGAVLVPEDTPEHDWRPAQESE